MKKVIYTDELMHFGVKGMKWGHRKTAQQRADYHISKIGSSSGIRRAYHNQRAYANELKALKKRQLKSDRTVLQKAGTRLGGSGYSSYHQKAASNYYDRRSKYAKNVKKANRDRNRAYNYDSLSKANAKVHNSKSVSSYVKNSMEATFKTPMKRVRSGKQVTSGRVFAERVAISTAINIATRGAQTAAMDTYLYGRG